MASIEKSGLEETEKRITRSSIVPNKETVADVDVAKQDVNGKENSSDSVSEKNVEVEKEKSLENGKKSDPIVEKSIDVEMKNADEVPELDENKTCSPAIKIGTPIGIPKAKIVLNKINKDDDILEVPVVKPTVDVIDVPSDDDMEATPAEPVTVKTEKEEETDDKRKSIDHVGDTEVVSEDELPPPPDKEKVDGAEEVSDEELPAAPKPDLPPEAEDVSDEELEPSDKKKKETKDDKDKEETTPDDADSAKDKGDKVSKLDTEKSAKTKDDTGTNGTKRKLSTSEDTKQDEATAKKPALDKNAERAKKLPELNKFWKAVKDDSSDFTGWTYLLQYVDQESDVEAAEEAYSAFLSHYPYCYGYWRKFADYERKKGSQKKCEEVFEQGLKAIPLSVDLWIHYINYIRATYTDKAEFIRKQYERSVDVCGMEFRSDRLWDSYIKWEVQEKEFVKAMKLFERVLRIPLQGHTTHFENFQKFIEKNSPSVIMSGDDLLEFRKEIGPTIKKQKDTADDDKPPGMDDDAMGEYSLEFTSASQEELDAIKEKLISTHKKIHKETANMVTERWTYEEGIKRPYFHVKPLEKCQLKNWLDYLNFEIRKGDENRISILFERCLIACALYEEFWYKYVVYLQEKSKGSDKIREVFKRCCTVHQPKKIAMHLEWANFEETEGNIQACREILEAIEKQHPKLVDLTYRRLSFEKRHGTSDAVQKLYDQYITTWTSESNKKEYSKHYFDLAVKYARYCSKVLKNNDKAIQILKKALDFEKTSNNLGVYTRLNFQLIDLLLSQPTISVKEIIPIFDALKHRCASNTSQKCMIVGRKLEFLEEFGKDIKEINATIKEFRALAEDVKKVSDSMKSVEKSIPLPVKKSSSTSAASGVTSTIKKPPKPSTKDAAPLPSQTPPLPPTSSVGPFLPPSGPPPFVQNQYPPPPINNHGVNPPFPQYPPPDASPAYQQWYNQYGGYNQPGWNSAYPNYQQPPPNQPPQY